MTWRCQSLPLPTPRSADAHSRRRSTTRPHAGMESKVANAAEKSILSNLSVRKGPLVCQGRGDGHGPRRGTGPGKETLGLAPYALGPLTGL